MFVILEYGFVKNSGIGPFKEMEEAETYLREKGFSKRDGNWVRTMVTTRQYSGLFIENPFDRFGRRIRTDTMVIIHVLPPEKD